jgi:hypothetical protein
MTEYINLSQVFILVLLELQIWSAFHGRYWSSGSSSELQNFPLIYFKNTPSAMCAIADVQFVPVNRYFLKSNFHSDLLFFSV